MYVCRSFKSSVMKDTDQQLVLRIGVSAYPGDFRVNSGLSVPQSSFTSTGVN